MKILYITREPFPTFRTDIKILFGKYLPKYRVYASIIAHRCTEKDYQWNGGERLLYNKAEWKIFRTVKEIATETLLSIKKLKEHDILQVRDKVAVSLLCLPIARIFNKPFYFWMSWPFPEDDLEKVKIQGRSLGIPAMIFTFIRGRLLQFFQYKVLFSYADHIFVQSKAMKIWLTEKGIDDRKMTPVPMGVDLEAIRSSIPTNKLSLKNKKIISYVGSLSQTRRGDILLDILEKLLHEEPNTHLLLIGGLPLGKDINWFQETARERGIEEHITITGWLSQEEAWSYLQLSDIALNILPRQVLFDTSSPTKLLEYAALGIPCVVTDNPDQKEMIEKLQCGVCVPYDVNVITKAVLDLINNPKLLKRYANSGMNNIGKYRSYSKISEILAKKYHELLAPS